MKDYKSWVLNETRMSTASWSDKDHETWENMHLENLAAISDVCKKHRVRWWLDSGTLLGIHRDGKIIPGDSDSDVGMHCDDITPDFINDMKKWWHIGAVNGMFYHHKDFDDMLAKDDFFPIKNIKFSSLKQKNGHIAKLKGKEVWTDLFIYFPWNKDMLYKYGGDYFRSKADVIGKPVSFQHKKISLKKPENPEKHLEINYGKEWKTPNPKYSPFDIDVYGGPLTKKDLGGRYMYNFFKKTHKIQ